MSMLPRLGLLALSLVGPPLLGAWLEGRSLAAYLAFPPRPRLVTPPAFDWVVFAVLAAVALAVLGLIAAAALPAPGERSAAFLRPRRVRRTPWWGWPATTLLAAGWAVAWTRVPWLAWLQPHTFLPLWLGYVGVVNALVVRRKGTALLVRRPGLTLALLGVSAVFWWYFEYLNLFTLNWAYQGGRGFGPVTYTAFATVSFATVLPAVIGTTELLGTVPALNHARSRLPPVRLRRPWLWSAGALVAGLAGLVGIAVWPNALYPLLWGAPLLVLLGLQPLLGERPYLAPLTWGDWRPLVLPALAALGCGALWELWNGFSLAHWQYAIPYVHRYQVFAMPVLGYAGYLPFGLECAVVAHHLVQRLGRRPDDLPLW